jgi:ABC-type multidrug transport system permease subunit
MIELLNAYFWLVGFIGGMLVGLSVDTTRDYYGFPQLLLRLGIFMLIYVPLAIIIEHLAKGGVQ